jgi:hypothetical protein
MLDLNSKSKPGLQLTVEHSYESPAANSPAAFRSASSPTVV